MESSVRPAAASLPSKSLVSGYLTALLVCALVLSGFVFLRVQSQPTAVQLSPVQTSPMYYPPPVQQVYPPPTQVVEPVYPQVVVTPVYPNRMAPPVVTVPKFPNRDEGTEVYEVRGGRVHDQGR